MDATYDILTLNGGNRTWRAAGGAILNELTCNYDTSGSRAGEELVKRAFNRHTYSTKIWTRVSPASTAYFVYLNLPRVENKCHRTTISNESNSKTLIIIIIIIIILLLWLLLLLFQVLDRYKYFKYSLIKYQPWWSRGNVLALRP